MELPFARIAEKTSSRSPACLRDVRNRFRSLQSAGPRLVISTSMGGNTSRTPPCTTCNGQDPSAVDSRFTRPFKPDFDEDTEIRAVCYWGESKSQVASLILQAPHPPKSYQCRYCKHIVEGYGDRIICPTCGVARVMYANGSHTDEAPAFKCPLAGRNTWLPARMPCCIALHAEQSTSFPTPGNSPAG